MMMSKSVSWEEDSMEYLIACLLLITCIAIYFPVAYIRKTNKLQKTLEQIEANTRKT